jgi:cyclic pyranopterin phosphate synthase
VSLPLPILDPGKQRPAFAAGPRDLAAVALLRLSLTDRCNLRCVYCMPEAGVEPFDRHDLLTADDVVAVAAAARAAGVTHFKLTGGEPTLRPDLLTLVRRLKALHPLDLSMTTNGLLLGQRRGRLARDLRAAGLDRLTISLDTLDADTFARLTGVRGFTLDQARAGIDAAVAAGFDRLKLNVVVVGGVNDHEAADFAALTLERPWTVRFIEYMPLGDSVLTDAAAGVATYTVDNAEVVRRIEAVHGPLVPVDRDAEPGVGPAQVFRLASARRTSGGEGGGKVGFISAMSRPFCERCNRLRLTARGELRACLFDGGEVDLRPVLHHPGLGEPQRRHRLIAAMRRCVAQKPDTHRGRGDRAMSQLGG